MLKACLDLGTNTALLLVGDWDEDSQTWSRIESDRSVYVRLGQGLVETKKFHPDALRRLEAALGEFSETLKQYGIPAREVIAVATASARDAIGAEELFAKIEKQFGLRFQTLSGEQEARGAFLGGVISTADQHSTVVVDLGGGSTECQTALGGVSFPIGSVKLTERFFPNEWVSDEEVWVAQEFIDEILKKELNRFHGRNLHWVGVAGTCTTLAQMQLGLAHFDASRIHGCEISVGDAHRWMSELKMRSRSERLELVGMDPNRADVLFAGALLLWRVMENFSAKSLRVSTRGLRYGLPQLNLTTRG